MSELLTEKQAILFPMVQQSSVGVVIQYISYFLLGIGFLPEMAWLSLASSPFVLFFSPVLVLVTIFLSYFWLVVGGSGSWVWLLFVLGLIFYIFLIFKAIFGEIVLIPLFLVSVFPIGLGVLLYILSMSI